MNITNSKTVKWNTTFRKHQKAELRRQAIASDMDINEFIVYVRDLNNTSHLKKEADKLKMSLDAYIDMFLNIKPTKPNAVPNKTSAR